MTKFLLALFLSKPRQTNEAVFKTCELFIYRDMRYVTDSLCRNMLNVATSAYAVNCLFIFFLLLSLVFLLPVMHRKMRGKITQIGEITQTGQITQMGQITQTGQITRLGFS